MQFRSPVLVSISFLFMPACATRHVAINAPRVIISESAYVVVEESTDRFVIVAKSRSAINEATQRLGCGQGVVCAENRNGEIWTIERFNR